MSHIPNYGQTFAFLRASAENNWTDYTTHEFVRKLEEGTLHKACFLHYLVQDYVFLLHFSRAWALGVVKSESLKELRTCAATVDALINTELALHIDVCKAAGIDETSLFSAQEEPENLAYTRYVIDAGLSGDFLDLMAALAPCVLGYGEIGLALQRSTCEQPNHPYRAWIDSYGGTEYQAVCKQVGVMLDTAVANRIGDTPQRSPRWSKLQTRFATACQLEANFWSMGLRAS